MRCPRCDANVSTSALKCNFCGQDLSVVHYVRRISNSYYNMGLEKAKVRDLSGAIVILKKSLQFYKGNTDARNLLGLIYYEMGETVTALSEWVLSKYLQAEDNAADYYIDTVRRNQTALDATNQTIKKYNSALSSAQAGNEDLAIIQLKKVVSLNPHFVRAQQLLALLYINEKDYSKAAKCLKRARSIDWNNTMTLRYMKEVGDKAATAPKSTPAVKKAPKKDPLQNVTPVGTYQEEKKSLMPVMQVIIGVIIGIAVCFFLIRPTLLKNGGEGGNQISEANEQLSVQSSQISSLKKEKAELNKEVDKLRKKIKNNDSLALKKAQSYEKLIEGVKYYMADDKISAAVAVSECKKTDFDTADAKELYAMIGSVTEEQIAQLVQTGYRTMSSSYEEAREIFKQALILDEDNQEALLWMGRCYQRLNKIKKAKRYYEKAIAVDDTSSHASQAEKFLQEMGVTSEDSGDNEGGDTGVTEP